MRTRRHLPALLIFILILATAARLYHIQSQSVWFDEGWSAYAAIQPTIEKALEADPTNPPLYYVLLNLFTGGFGDSTLSLRWVSTLLGLLVIPLSYQLAKRLFDERAGIMAAFLTAFCPLLWWASQEIRMYTLLAVLVLVAALAWHELLRRPSWRAWLALWISELALLYAHNTGLVVVVWLNAITVLAWVIALISRFFPFKSPPPNPLPATQGGGIESNQIGENEITSVGGYGAFVTRRSMLIWFGGQIAVGLLWSPWFVSKFLLLPSANSALSHISPMSMILLGDLWQAVWAGAWAMVDKEAWIITFSTGIFAAAVVLIPWHKGAARWLVLHVLLLTGGVWLGLTLLGNEIHGRYLVMIAPLLLVVIGAGIARLNRGGSQTLPYRYLAYPVLALFAVTFIISVYFVTVDPDYQHDDARGMAQYYADHLTAKDTVLDWSYADRYELAYYWPRLGVKAQRVTLPEGADLDRILPLLPKSGDVALNVWYTQRADFRGMMDCILSNGTINLPEEYTVYGMSDRLYRAPSLDVPELLPANISVADMAMVTAMGGITSATADQALCLPLKLSLTQKTDADLKAVVIVENSLGWEVARADATFADAAQETTSQLAPGDNVTAYALLRLPYGAPAGDYRIILRIYDEVTHPSGYDLISSDGSPTREDVPVGTWRVSSGAAWQQVNRGTDLPVSVQIPVNHDLALVAHNAVGGTFRNGDILRLALLWRGSGDLPDLTMADVKGAWSVAIPANIGGERDAISLDWREVQIPPDAPDGTAEVRLPDGTVIGTYTIESVPALYSPPAFDTPVEADIPGVGKLVGYTVSGDMTDRSQPFGLTLVWQAEGATDISYTVFAQLVTDDGRVLAQSDSNPAGGSRRTTSWRPGEYIEDAHEVVFHDEAAPGTARLIVGFYDDASGKRLTTSAGDDTITLQQDVEVH